MVMPLDLAFASRELEGRFTDMLIKHKGEELGGVFFWDWDRINKMHYKRHEAIFGDRSIAMISDYIVCPNTSNLRNREYMVSDLSQLVGIAEATAESRHCLYLHWHTHPNGDNMPSENDKAHWVKHWSNKYYHVWGAIACIRSLDDTLHVRCHEVIKERGTPWQTVGGQFYGWNYINYLIRRYNKRGSK